jgi:dTDP-glucose 4,6-dehydratase
MMRLLITGGAGFIGCNFVRLALERGYGVTVLDKLTYAGRKENLADVLGRIRFVAGDIRSKRDVAGCIADCDVVLNFAAETHVDRSITRAGAFVKTDVLGTYALLEACRKRDVKRYVQVSTDEVYGSIASGAFGEGDALEPSSPYSASKAGADMLVMAYKKTYGLPVLITRSSNNYGPFQHPEKFIPKCITNALRGRKIPVYGDGGNVRDWIFVRDNCEAIAAVLERGETGGVYNIGTGEEQTNIDVVRQVLSLAGAPESLIKFVADRKGHDLRYALDCGRIRALGWKPGVAFAQGLRDTVQWYASNAQWWEPLV